MVDNGVPESSIVFSNSLSVVQQVKKSRKNMTKKQKQLAGAKVIRKEPRTRKNGD